MRVARAEHHLGAALGQRAAGARAGLDGERLQRSGRPQAVDDRYESSDAIADRPLDGGDRGDADGVDRGVDPAGGRRHEGVAVDPGVGRDDAGPGRRGRPGRPRGSRACRAGRWWRPRRWSCCRRRASGRPRPRSARGGAVGVDVAEGVDGTSALTTRSPWRTVAVPSPPGRRAIGPAPLADGGPGAGPDRTDVDRPRPTPPSQARYPASAARPHRRRRRPPRSNSPSAGTIGTGPAGVGKPMPLLLAPPHHPVGRGQPEGRAAGQQDRVDPVDEPARAPRASSSRVAGAPPRTSAEPIVPSGRSTTVQPVPGVGVGPVADRGPRPRR